MTTHARLFACAIAGLTAGAFSAYATPSAAQSTPYGSYSSSCQVETSAGGYISGYCRTDDGGRRWSSIRYADCYGDISNRDGVLSCQGARASEGPYYPPEGGQTGAQIGGPSTGQGVIEAIAGAILGSVLGVQPGQGGLYDDGYRYPTYGQQGYGDPRYDPRYGQDGWGYGHDRQWVSINDRSDWFERRIETGRRQGRLTDYEINSLRTEFRSLVQLERRYQSGGLSSRERIDLDQRFDQLAARIRVERRDDDVSGGGWGGGDWRSITDRRWEFDQALQTGLRDRHLTRYEAERLRRDFDDLVRQETEYSRNGLDRYERQSLDGRYDDLIQRTGSTASDGWTPISSRAGDLERAIDEARRTGRINRYESDRLRTDLSELLRLETSYQRDGLSPWERQQLDSQYDALVARTGVQTGGGWPPQTGGSDWPVASQRTDLTARIDGAERYNRISRSEATRLRTELADLLRLEEGYASDGLSESERSYLRYRMDALSALVPR